MRNQSPILNYNGKYDIVCLEEVRDIQTAINLGYEFVTLMLKTRGNIQQKVESVEGVRIRRGGTAGNSDLIDKVVQGCSCTFIPLPDTGTRYAHLLYKYKDGAQAPEDSRGIELPKGGVSQINLDFLASHFYEDRWTIEDNEVLEKVKKLVKEKNVPKERPYSVNAQPLEVEDLAEVNKPLANAMSRDQAKEIAHTKHASLIAEIRKKKSNYWLSSKYREIVKPDIDKLMTGSMSMTDYLAMEEAQEEVKV